MASDLQIQGEVVVNSEQAEGAFNRVGDKAQQMANEVATSAGKAGQAVDKIGDGAGASADKFTRAESRISASIKRATNELELLGKTASQRLEFNIADKGLDAAKFEPALKKLREIEAQALQAQRAATGSLDKMGISAAQTAAALRGVPAQFTDIVTSLQGGQAPLTVFLQQGGQLKDMFGGAGNAARALGGYVLGLVNPFTIAAAAVGALAFAYNQGSKEADAYNKALITTGNAAGTNAAQLKAYAQEISGIVGTQGKAAESLAALASTGKVGAESLRDAAKAAVEYERATGQAVGKTAEQFASLRNEPLAAVLKLNDGMNFLTDSTYKQIKSLEEQGRTAEAANVAQRAFADTLSSRAGEMERNLGSVERGWLKVKDAAKGAWDAILNVGRASTSVDQLAEVRRQIAQRENQIANAGFATNEGGAAFGRPSLANTERLRAELTGLQAQAAALEGVAYASRTAAEEERKRGEAVKATAAFDKAGEKFLTEKAKMERELAAARVQGAEAGKSQAEVEQRLTEIRASYAKKGGSTVAAENKELRDQMRVYAELAGVSTTYYAELANYQKQRAAGLLTEEKYVSLVEALIEKQPFAIAQAKSEYELVKLRVKAYEEAAKAEAKVLEQRQKSADTAQNQVQRLQDEEQAAAMAAAQNISLAQALEMVALARLREEEVKLRSQGADGATLLALQQEIEAREKIIGLINSRDTRKAAEDSSKDAAKEWERAAEDINRSLTDALLRGFESGKGFAENLRDTLKNMFNTLVLRPIISAVLAPVSGALGGLLGGGAGGAAGGAGGLSNIASLGMNAYSLYGNFAGASGLGGLSSFAGGYSGAILPANMVGPSIAQPTIMSGLGNTASGFTGGAGSGSAIAGAGVFAAVVGVVLNALGAFRSERRNGSGLMGTLGSGDLSPWEEWREGGTLFSGPSFSTMNPVQELESRRAQLQALKDNGQGNTQQAATLQVIVDNLENLYGDLADQTKAQSKAIQTAYDALRTNVGDMADVLGLGSEAVRAFTTQLGGSDKGLNFEGLSGEEIAAKITEALATANNDLAQQVIGRFETTTTTGSRIVSENIGSQGEDQNVIYTDVAQDPVTSTRYVESEFARDGEKAIDTLTRLATSLSAANASFELLGFTLFDASLAGADVASSLADAFGGIDRLNALSNDFFQNFYSPEEQRANIERQLAEAFSDLNLDLPDIDATDAREQYRRLVTEASGDMSEEGRAAYVTLLELAGAFAGVTNAAQDATAALEAQRQANQDNAYSMFQRALGRDRDALNDQASTLEDTISGIADAVDLLRSNARDLYGTVDSTAQMLAAQGMVYIENALAGVRAGASVADYTGLGDAIGAARGGIESGRYTSQFERERDALVLAGQLSQLAESGEVQLSIEEQQLRAVKAQLDYLDSLDKQAEALVNGTEALTETVQTYFDRLMAFLMPETAAPGGGGATSPSGGFVVGGGSSGGGAAKPTYGNLDPTRAVFVDSFINGLEWQGGDKDAGSTAALAEYARANSISQADLADRLGFTPEQIREHFDKYNIPAFDVGTDYVPKDMLAFVHKGEKIVPKAYNPAANPGMSGGNAELVAEVRALRGEVAALRAAGEKTADNTALVPQMARQTDTYTNGGQFSRQKALA